MNVNTKRTCRRLLTVFVLFLVVAHSFIEKGAEYNRDSCAADAALDEKGLNIASTAPKFSLENTYCTAPGSVSCVYHDKETTAKSCSTASACYNYCATMAHERKQCIKTKAKGALFGLGISYDIIVGGPVKKPWVRLCSQPKANPDYYSNLGLMMKHFVLDYTKQLEGNGRYALPKKTETEYYCFGRIEQYVVHAKTSSDLIPEGSEFFLPGSTKKVTEVTCTDKISASPSFYVLNVIVMLVVFYLF